MALLETPAAQCTRTLPPDSSALWMKETARGKCCSRSASSVSYTGMIRRDLQLSCGLKFSGQSAMAVSTWV